MENQSNNPGQTKGRSEARDAFRHYRRRLREFGGDLSRMANDPVFLHVRERFGGYDWKAGTERAARAGAGPVADGVPQMMDPVRFKRILVRIIKILIIWELVSDFITGAKDHAWGPFINDAIIAGVLFFTWGRILALLREKREEYRVKVEAARGELGMKDAIIFSLLWSDEIFDSIPPDRRRIATISYSLIAIGIVVAVLHIGGKGLMPIALSGALVLAAVNLLVWVVSLERGERDSLQTELRLAHEVQDSLMPETAPEVPGLDIAGVSIPANEVGGDLFDYSFAAGDSNQLAIAVADVSGKGMKAAMASVFTMGAYSSFVATERSPGTVLTRLNKAVFSHTTRGNFVAFLLVMIDAQTRKMTFTNAGQTKPMLKSGNAVRSLDGVGVNFGLGMRNDSEYADARIDLLPGDVLFLLSDGFTDAMNSIREFYGTERLAARLRAMDTASRSASQILEAVREDVRLFTGDSAQHDDMTLVVVKIV